ncbi:MAG: hypothetical protein JWM43_101 [Acidobacteriaceae bacterium]|nr:hypothetical protein [Acidobacteriaceae bacterium]
MYSRNQAVSRMFTRSQQISSPLILPMLGSIVTTSVIASIVLLPPSRPTLSLQQLLLRAAFDLTIAVCIHIVTVWSIWRLIREYVEPSAGTLAVHIWAAVVWLPLITTLSAERSLWISCLVPWAFANAVTFLNLWSKLPQDEEPVAPTAHVLFQSPSTPPLLITLLPYCITIVVLQAGLASLASGHPWAAAALISASVLLFLVRYPFVRGVAKSRRTFSRFSLLQTAAVFFLISTALTPYLQKAYGLRSLASFLATPAPVTRATPRLASGSAYSGVILTLPAKPHPRIEPPTRSNQTDFSAALPKPVIIPFDGAYWYFKRSDTRPKPDARIQQGDPIKANVSSTDRRELAMEAHQMLSTSISGDCCRAMRIDLLNGDDRPGLIRIELLLRDTSGKPGSSILLGSLPIPSSQLRHIPLNRPPVPESLRFQMPATAHGRRFDEITVVIKPSSDRALAGSKIAIQNFVLIP